MGMDDDVGLAKRSEPALGRAVIGRPIFITCKVTSMFIYTLGKTEVCLSGREWESVPAQWRGNTRHDELDLTLEVHENTTVSEARELIKVTLLYFILYYCLLNAKWMFLIEVYCAEDTGWENVEKEIDGIWWDTRAIPSRLVCRWWRKDISCENEPLTMDNNDWSIDLSVHGLQTNSGRIGTPWSSWNGSSIL